ncbi:MAG: bifunctional aconitate hydratase 2/2-methylisocitrate dehydratase [Acidobacteriota bacterium]|nr:bifunctional aconitate hydratase 2/2-methylisocitrate dehydratase [Acidobacteriota bacterium]MDW3228536.1 bifunctional aconitate hydratase 2/2-methylisocitrate dehydratase [Acidobacteriota bacterium]MDY0231292.1 bifunctional aconitate hydratase 2/2-methylisocitrate dehydratase [Candidatus Saccharicenans sp.]
MLESYYQKAKERETQGIPPAPLTVQETQELCQLLENPPSGKEQELLYLLEQRVPPGVDQAARVKAGWLSQVALGRKKSPLVNPERAVILLGTMVGGYNVDPLINMLEIDSLAQLAADALKYIILVYNAYDKIVALSKTNKYAKEVLTSWAKGEWFLSRPELPEELVLKVYKVDGEINTDDLSPAKYAWSRPDIPLHALSMGETRFPGGLEVIRKFREEGYKVAFVGDVIGTGSSRKSACNSLMWHIGEDIPYIPNKRRGGIVIGGLIAPIFFNTTEDSGGLPIQADVSQLKTGDVIIIKTRQGIITDENGQVLAKFDWKPATIIDEFRAGGRLNLIIGRQLTARARKELGWPEADFFLKIQNPEPKPGQGFTLAQKILGQACGQPGILPGTACEPKMTTVGSQDTTGPMTADELKELACLEFQTELFMQSFCHTAAYPKPTDVKMHQDLASFVIERKGLALKPGDGVIHSWLNRLILPDTVGTGGDSHTRFPVGISFPAGSGLVAFAGALGFMPLDMPESVLVRFYGQLKSGITLRDVVNAIPYFAIKQSLLTVAKKGKKNIFNGRILEIEGLEGLTVEQAYELTDASAERSAAACVIALDEEKVVEYLKSNVALMKKMIEEGYQDSDSLEKRIQACESWIKNPVLLKRDTKAEYAAVIDIDLGQIKEPILACPNDPDDVRLLSGVAGDKIDEVFIGSCMTNIGHFRAAAKIFEKSCYPSTRIWLTPPTKMDYNQLKREGLFAAFAQVGARVEIPGCSLCMGNQARVKPGATVISTSTRNFDNRMGDGARVYLSSAELAAVAAVNGQLPSADKYFKVMQETVIPQAEQIYRYLEFHKMGDFNLSYV